jgi:choline dehydrogenase-like flavoprotein
MRPHYDVVVVGSGYGASACASRLSRAGKVHFWAQKKIIRA